MRFEKTNAHLLLNFPEIGVPPWPLINARITRSSSPEKSGELRTGFHSQAVAGRPLFRTSDRRLLSRVNDVCVRPAAVTVTRTPIRFLTSRELILRVRNSPRFWIGSIHDRSVADRRAIVDFHPNLLSSSPLLRQCCRAFDEDPKSSPTGCQQQSKQNRPNST